MRYIDRLERAVRTVAAVAVTGAALLAGSSPVAAQNKTPSGFSHEPHRQVACVACHASDSTGVGPAHVTPQQCNSCHHSNQTVGGCNSCHKPAQLTRPHRKVQQFQLSVAPAPVERTVVFEHQAHQTQECRACHKTTARPNVAAVACNSCHEQHHAQNVACTSCHETHRNGAHDSRAHLGCTGSGCHSSSPVQASARSRQLCLTCHTEQAEHRPGATCVECHVLPMPNPRPGTR